MSDAKFIESGNYSDSITSLSLGLTTLLFFVNSCNETSVIVSFNINRNLYKSSRFYKIRYFQLQNVIKKCSSRKKNLQNLNVLLHQFETFNIKLQFLGKFSLDNKLLYSIFTATFTYILVMIQFELDSSTFIPLKDLMKNYNPSLNSTFTN